MLINKEETLPESVPTFNVRKRISLLKYQGTRNFQDSINFLTLLETTTVSVIEFEKRTEKERKEKTKKHLVNK